MDFMNIDYTDTNDPKLSESNLFDIATKLQPVVFKYRSWSNDLHKKILTEQTVYYARPSEFEDNKDCMIRKQYERITDEDLFRRYLDSSRRINPNYMESEHLRYAEEWTKESPLKNKENLKNVQANYFDLLNKQWGILSLTRDPVSEEMWKKYGDNHKGFCVGLLTGLFYMENLGFIGDVKYFDELPEILPDDSPEIESIKQIYFKESGWQFEKEIRSAKVYWHDASYEDRSVKISEEIICTVIFGKDMPNSHKEDIRAVCRANNLNVMFHDVIVENGALYLKKL
jgi:hypothetical protein